MTSSSFEIFSSMIKKNLRKLFIMKSDFAPSYSLQSFWNSGFAIRDFGVKDLELGIWIVDMLYDIRTLR